MLRCRIYQYATVQIQKIFRGMIGRNLMLQYRYERNVKCANIIKKEYFIYAERKRLRLLKYRQHMAAYKIQVTHTHTLSLTHIHTHSLSYTNTHKCTNTLTCTHTHRHTCIHTYIHKRTQIYTYIQSTHAYTYAHTANISDFITF